MSAPQLKVFIQGLGQVAADNLNTFMQTCDIISQLRNFIGAPGVSVQVRGSTIPGGGGAGIFWWNPNANGPDDNFNNIVPNGAGSGCWQRLTLVPSTPLSLTDFSNLAVGGNWTAAWWAAVNTGMSFTVPAGHFGFDPTASGTLTITAAGQRIMGIGGDQSIMEKWGNGVLIDLEGDSCGIIGLTLVGQFQRATLIAAGYLSASSPSVNDTTDTLTIGANSVGVTDSPTGTTLQYVRTRGAGRDGINWMEGTQPYWNEVTASGCGRYGFSGDGTAIDRSGLVGGTLEATACGNNPIWTIGGGFEISGANGAVAQAKAFQNYGPGFILVNNGGAFGSGSYNRWNIYDEQNGSVNSNILSRAQNTVYLAGASVQNSYSISTTTSGVQNPGTTTIPVTSGTAIPNGTAISIAGAGINGAALVTLVIAGGGTASLTVETPVSTSVTGAAVTGTAIGIFVATVGGTSSASATGPNVATGTVVDGTVTWQARDSNAVEMLVGQQNKFEALALVGPAVVSSNAITSHFNNLSGAQQGSLWANSELIRYVQQIVISQVSRFTDPSYSPGANTVGGLLLDAPVPGSPNLFRMFPQLTGLGTQADLILGDLLSASSGVNFRLRGSTLSGARTGGMFGDIVHGGRINPLSGAALTSSYDFATSGPSGGVVDASEADVYLMNAAGGALTFNIESGGANALPGRVITIVKADTSANHVTVSGNGYYIIGDGSNTLTAISITLTASACSTRLRLLSTTLGTTSTPLWLKEQ